MAHFTLSVLAFVIAVAALLAMSWLRFHDTISAALLAVRQSELTLAGFVYPRSAELADAVGTLSPQGLTAATAWTMLTVTGSVFRPAAVVILAICTVIAFLRAANTRYPGEYGLPHLQAELAKAHPIGAAWVGRSLPPKNIDPDSPLRPLDPPLTDAEWIGRYAVFNGTFSSQRAQAALGAQCGARWAGLRNASPQTQCLALVFGLHGSLKGAAAQELLGELSRSVPHRRQDSKEGPAEAFTVSRRFSRSLQGLLRKHSTVIAAVEAVGERHAFETGVLLTLLQQARLRGGLLNPGMFSSVQFYDRNLWLVLQAATFPADRGPFWTMTTTRCVESAGAIAHWQAECVAEEPIESPAVSDPLDTILTIARRAD